MRVAFSLSLSLSLSLSVCVYVCVCLSLFLCFLNQDINSEKFSLQEARLVELESVKEASRGGREIENWALRGNAKPRQA